MLGIVAAVAFVGAGLLATGVSLVVRSATSLSLITSRFGRRGSGGLLVTIGVLLLWLAYSLVTTRLI